MYAIYRLLHISATPAEDAHQNADGYEVDCYLHSRRLFTGQRHGFFPGRDAFVQKCFVGTCFQRSEETDGLQLRLHPGTPGRGQWGDHKNGEPSGTGDIGTLLSGYAADLCDPGQIYHHQIQGNATGVAEAGGYDPAWGQRQQDKAAGAGDGWSRSVGRGHDHHPEAGAFVGVREYGCQWLVQADESCGRSLYAGSKLYRLRKDLSGSY